MSRTDLEQAIFDTIRYFDILALPVTAVQIWRSLIIDRDGTGQRWHGQPVPSLAQIRAKLTDSVWLQERVAAHWGYWCLQQSGRVPHDYVLARLRRYGEAQRKWKIARRAALVLARLPLVRMVGVTGSLALSNTHVQSDVDLLIVVRRGRIWAARLLLLLVTQLMGRRRTYDDRQAPDKLCLNHYITDDALAMAPALRSVYTAVLYRHVVPLSGLPVYRRWLAANESWIRRWLQYPTVPLVAPRQYVRVGRLAGRLRGWVEAWLREPVGEALERAAERLQRRTIARHYEPARAGRVVVSSTELAFHPASQEGPILRRFSEEYGQGRLL